MKISQREARRNLKRLGEFEREIERQRRTWSQDYFGAVEIARLDFDPMAPITVAVRTARKLSHAVVCVGDDGGVVRFMALPHPRVPS